MIYKALINNALYFLAFHSYPRRRTLLQGYTKQAAFQSEMQPVLLCRAHSTIIAEELNFRFIA